MRVGHARDREAVAHPRAPCSAKRARRPASASSVASAAASAATSPTAAAGRSRRRRQRSQCHPLGRHDGTPAASASIATTGVPSFAEVSRNASKVEYHGADLVPVTEELHSLVHSELMRERCAPDRPPRRHRRSRAPRLGTSSNRANEVLGTLDRGQPARPADHERRVGDAQLSSEVGACRSETEPTRASRSKPYGTTTNLSVGATCRRTRSSLTSSLTATSVLVECASARSTARKTRSRRESKYPVNTCPW